MAGLRGFPIIDLFPSSNPTSEVRIYKRKEEKKKTRKQENRKKTRTRPRK